MTIRRDVEQQGVVEHRPVALGHLVQRSEEQPQLLMVEVGDRDQCLASRVTVAVLVFRGGSRQIRVIDVAPVVADLKGRDPGEVTLQRHRQQVEVGAQQGRDVRVVLRIRAWLGCDGVAGGGHRPCFGEIGEIELDLSHRLEVVLELVAILD